MWKRPTPAERFARKFRIDPDTDCWLWTGSVRVNGYAQFRYTKEKNGYGHRFSYELFVGPIPEGLELDHLCSVRLCVNPRHLEAVSAKENVFRSRGIASRNAKKTHCKRGHLLSGVNVYRYKGKRHCRECRRLDGAARYQRSRSQPSTPAPPASSVTD